MPCRALEAFRRLRFRCAVSPITSKICLNALSGIGGVQTNTMPIELQAARLRLNALSGIGGVQTR